MRPPSNFPKWEWFFRFVPVAALLAASLAGYFAYESLQINRQREERDFTPTVAGEASLVLTKQMLRGGSIEVTGRYRYLSRMTRIEASSPEGLEFALLDREGDPILPLATTTDVNRELSIRGWVQSFVFRTPATPLSDQGNLVQIRVYIEEQTAPPLMHEHLISFTIPIDAASAP